jgi:hypothetical protein
VNFPLGRNPVRPRSQAVGAMVPILPMSSPAWVQIMTEHPEEGTIQGDKHMFVVGGDE